MKVLNPYLPLDTAVTIMCLEREMMRNMITDEEAKGNEVIDS